MPKPWRAVLPLRATAYTILITGVALGATVRAQEAPVRLETVTVTATRLATQAELPTAVTLLDRATLDLRNKWTVPDMLADVAGLNSNQPGGRGSVGEIVLRGGEPNFTAVLIDGIQMNDPTNTRGGSFDFSALDINEVQAIEIDRGPLSSIYGSDALSGVINIVTRRPTDELASGIAMTLGSEELASASARIGGPLSRGSRFLINAGARRDGHADADSGYRNKNISGSLQLFTHGESPLTIAGRSSETSLHAYPDSSGGPRLAVLRIQDQRHLRDDSLGLSWRRPLSARTSLHLHAALLEHDEDVDSPGVAGAEDEGIPANRNRTEFSRESLTLFLRNRATERLSSVVGIGYERQRGTGDGALTLGPGFELPTSYALTRSDAAIFGELAYAVSRSLTLAGALRHDDNGSAAQETTGKLGLSYALPDGRTRLRASWAQGFKLPSLFSLGDALVGNPDLEAETVTAWEVGVDYGRSGDRLELSLTAFAQRFENLIDFDFEQFMSVNRDAVDADGVELSGRLNLGEKTTVLGHATWVDLDVIGSDQALRQRPERRGGLGVEWQATPAISLYAGLRYVGERLDEAIPTGERTLPSYTRADASLTVRLSASSSLEIALDNLTDEDYEDAIGFPSLGARARVGLRVDLL